MAATVATLDVEITFTIDKLTCACANPRKHAPYRDSEPRRNALRRMRARILRRPLVNMPCPTPIVERVVKTEFRKMTPAEISAATGGTLG